MQSNANRIRNVLKLTKNLLFVFGGLIIFFDLSNIDNLSSVVSILWFAVCLLWLWFDKHLWKKEWINTKLRFIKSYYCPSIGGRWKGTLIRDGKEHEFVLEVKQTYTSISCETYSRHSHSKCTCTELLYDEQNDSYSFVYLWQGKSLKSPDGKDVPSNSFTGTTILKISEDCKTLDGSYFTDRSPKQTKGTIKLNYEQETLKNAF